VTGKIINRFKGTQEATVDFLRDDAFESVVRANLERYVDSFDDPDAGVSFEPIEQSELEVLLEKFPGASREHEDKPIDPAEFLYREIKTGATEAVSDMLSAGDIKQILREIDDAYRARNRRPVLIIEDLTGFTVYDHEVLSFFSDLGAAHFDVVIGVTTGVNQRLVDSRRADVASQDTIDDRIQARLRLTEAAEDGSGSRTLFLEQEDIHIDLARKYLDAIKRDADVSYDPPLPRGLTDADVEAAFDGLYPFNRPFLDRIYENLQEENVTKQTPRVYLTFVINELLDNRNPPFEHAEKLRQRLGTVENRIDPDYTAADEPVLKWYGTDEGDHYAVDERIPHAFDIDSDGGAPTLGEAEELCPECAAPIYDASGEWECPECGYTPGGSEPRTKRDVFAEQRNELLAWLRGETDFNQTSNIEAGAQRVITYFFDAPTSLRIPECRSSDAAYLRWEKGSDRVPVHVRNADTPRYTQVELTTDIDQSVLVDLLQVGVWDGVSLQDMERQENIDLDRLRAWASRAVDQLRTTAVADIEDTYGVSLDELALFGKYVLNVFAGKGTEFTPEAIAKPAFGSEIYQVYSQTRFDGDINALKNNVDLFTGLFHARFHLRRNVVDHDRLRKAMATLDPETLLLRVDSIDGSISGFKIGSTGQESMELDEFLKTRSFNLRGYAHDISEYQAVFTDDLTAVRTELSELADGLEGINDGVPVDVLDDAYGPLSRTRPTVLDDVAALDDECVSTFVEAVSETHEAVSQCEDVWEFLLAQRRAGILKYRWMSDTYSTLKSFLEELDALDDDLDARIAELQAETYTPHTAPYDQTEASAERLLARFSEVSR
jgi:rubrerythrin